MDLQRFGYKFTDTDHPELESILTSAERERCPIEIGLYHSHPRAIGLLTEALAESELPINTHLDHNQYSIFGISERLDDLARQIERAQALGSTYSITHLATTPLGQRAKVRRELVDGLVRELRLVNALCCALDHRIHVENTFHDLDLYQELFAAIANEQLEQIHCCFDIGHAKVWSTRPFSHWLEWLKDVEEAGFSLHMHLHANGGIKDEHLSFVEADARGLDAPDEYMPEGPYWALAQLGAAHPEARKVYEVKPAYAVRNRHHTQAHIQRLRAIKETRSALG